MKYLLVIDQIKQGGAERILVDFDAYLKQLGHKVKVFAMCGKKEDSPWTESLDVTYGCSSSDDSFLGKLLQFITIYKTFKNLVSSYKPDGIYSSLEKSNFLTSLAWASEQMRSQELQQTPAYAESSRYPRLR